MENIPDIEKTIEEAKAVILPYESWEQLQKESSKAFSAFCAFRDHGADRTIKKVFLASLKGSSYKQWCNWSREFKWFERVAAYDRYIEQLKQTELRKTIEANAEKQREVIGQMIGVLKRKLTTMNADDLPINAVPVWATTTGSAVKADMEAAGLIANDSKTNNQQLKLSFEPEFQGL